MADEPEKNQHIAETLLQRAHPDDVAATIYKEHVKQRPLLLRPSSPDRSNARGKRQHERLVKQRARQKSKKPKPLSAKQKRALCLYDIPKEQQKYEIYKPLHQMWCGYIREILGLSASGDVHVLGKTCVDANGAGPMLASADYHGALVEVVRSRCVGRVGLKGIVVKDTRFTFEIVTTENVLKIVPKEHTVFRFEVPFEEAAEKAEASAGNQTRQRRPLVFEIYGSQFETRAPDRANKKFRLHIDPDL